MNTEPTVSVIIPTYNRELLITRAIRSVLNQTYRDFELIVVDDGSIDNTVGIVNGFNDPRIKYIRHDKNRGVAAARNTGIKAARGSYIAFQDSDDEWLPTKLEKQLQAFTAAPPKVGVVYSGVWRVENNKKTYFIHYAKRGNLYYSLFKLGFIYLQSAMVKKECFFKVGIFDEEIPGAEDWELWLRISKYYHFRCIEEPSVSIYDTPDSLSKQQNLDIKIYHFILTKYQDDFKKDKGLLSDYLLAVGNYLCENSDFTKGKGYLIQSVKANPLNVLAVIGMIASLCGENVYLRVVTIYRKVREWKLSREPRDTWKPIS